MIHLLRLGSRRLYPSTSTAEPSSLRVTAVGRIFSLKFQRKTVTLSGRAEGSGVEWV